MPLTSSVVEQIIAKKSRLGFKRKKRRNAFQQMERLVKGKKKFGGQVHFNKFIISGKSLRLQLTSKSFNHN